MKKLNWSIQDKVNSLYNRTHISMPFMRKYVSQLKQKLELSTEDSLRLLINWSIDKKLNLEKTRTKIDGLPVNKITNIKELCETYDKNKYCF